MRQIRNDKLLERIALRIKELREKNFLSQEEIYLDTNINVARIESEKTNISISTLEALCRYFNITLKDFFEGIE
jgi:transcriptional regulator with XRE-family HTH domain